MPKLKAPVPHLSWSERHVCVFLVEPVPHDWRANTPEHFYHKEQLYRSSHDERLVAHGYAHYQQIANLIRGQG